MSLSDLAKFVGAVLRDSIMNDLDKENEMLKEENVKLKQRQAVLERRNQFIEYNHHVGEDLQDWDYPLCDFQLVREGTGELTTYWAVEPLSRLSETHPVSNRCYRMFDLRQPCEKMSLPQFLSAELRINGNFVSWLGQGLCSGYTAGPYKLLDIALPLRFGSDDVLLTFEIENMTPKDHTVLEEMNIAGMEIGKVLQSFSEKTMTLVHYDSFRDICPSEEHPWRSICVCEDYIWSHCGYPPWNDNH
jgi:hypothetical protein